MKNTNTDVNVVMLTHNRPNLTRQSIESLYAHTDEHRFNLTIVDDGSDLDTIKVISEYVDRPNMTLLEVIHSDHVLGKLKNLGVVWSQMLFGEGRFLCICDNDVYFKPNWLGRMMSTYRAHLTLGLLGGQVHPYHEVSESRGTLQVTTNVAGYTHFMSWSSWDLNGPYEMDCNSGIGMLEDVLFCDKVRGEDLLIGYISPPAILHTGSTDSNGNPAVGSEAFEKVAGVLYE